MVTSQEPSDTYVTTLPALCRHTQEYYQRFVRESFVNHEDEVSAERLAQIVQRAGEDAEWVLKKARAVCCQRVQHTPALALPQESASLAGCGE